MLNVESGSSLKLLLCVKTNFMSGRLLQCLLKRLHKICVSCTLHAQFFFTVAVRRKSSLPHPNHEEEDGNSSSSSTRQPDHWSCSRKSIIEHLLPSNFPGTPNIRRNYTLQQSPVAASIRRYTLHPTSTKYHELLNPPPEQHELLILLLLQSRHDNHSFIPRYHCSL